MNNQISTRVATATNNEGQPMLFEILDSVKPSVNGKDKYQRLLIRRVPPRQKFISLCDICDHEGWDMCETCEIEAVLIK
jgi:hypothetical protein